MQQAVDGKLLQLMEGLPSNGSSIDGSFRMPKLGVHSLCVASALPFIDCPRGSTSMYVAILFPHTCIHVRISFLQLTAVANRKRAHVITTIPQEAPGLLSLRLAPGSLFLSFLPLQSSLDSTE